VWFERRATVEHSQLLPEPAHQAVSEVARRRHEAVKSQMLYGGMR